MEVHEVADFVDSNEGEIMKKEDGDDSVDETDRVDKPDSSEEDSAQRREDEDGDLVGVLISREIFRSA